MKNAPTRSGPTPGPDNAAMSARLSVIEERLDEIITRLDELKNLLTRFNPAKATKQSPTNR